MSAQGTPIKDEGTYEEHPTIRIRMLIRNPLERPIPIRPSKVRRTPQTRDRVPLRADILDQDVVHVVVLDLGGEVDGDFDPALGVLFLDRVQEGVEPFGGAEITDDPGEVDFGEAGLLFGAKAARRGVGGRKEGGVSEGAGDRRG